MSTVVNLGTLRTEGFVIIGDDGGDRAGWSVSDAGDVNGDGLADVIIGAPKNSDDAGRAYVIFGRSAKFGDIDLSNLQPADGFVIRGDPRDLAGFAVSAAGDFNGDGFDDIVVGTTPYGFYGAFTKAYLIFGKADPPAAIDLSSISTSDGVFIGGQYAYDSNGWLSAGAAGDVNGDGFDDLIFGSPYDNGAAGAAYVVFGKASGFVPINLINLPPDAGFEIIGQPGSEDFAGFSVSGAGDVNGDGYDDVIVGAPYGDNGGGLAGEAYVVFGKATGFGTIDLSNLAAGSGFVIQGHDAEDKAGWSVSGAGDINGDGFADIVVGAPYGNGGAAHSGDTYVIFGRGNGPRVIDLTNLTPDAGFTIRGDDTGDHAGRSVSAAGDVNGDGFDDIIVGAPGNDNTRGGAPRVIDAGEAYVIFGKASGFGTIDLTSLAPSDGFIIQGSAAYDQAGWSVSGGGDLDGDGFDDLVIGAPYADQGGPNAGAVYIISGRLQFTADVRNDFNRDGRSDVMWRNDSGAFSVWHGQTDGSFLAIANSNSMIAPSWQVVGAGDFDGDGRDDVVWRHDSGLFSAWHGQSDGGFAASTNSNTSVSPSWDVAGTGDFNGDGRDDVIWRHDSGLFSAWHGRTDGGFAASANSNTSVSLSWDVVGTGDFNGDRRDDVLWRHSSGDFSAWMGQRDGSFVASALSNVTISNAWHVVGTGDFNGDGRDDVLWLHDSGVLSAWHGQANGGFLASANSHASVSTTSNVVGTGDFNGDDRDDILWRDDSGQFRAWHGQTDGSFVMSPNSSAQVSTSWHVQPDYLL